MMNSNPFQAVIDSGEYTAEQLQAWGSSTSLSDSPIGKAITGGLDSITHPFTDPLKGLKSNLAPLAVGLGLFFLGVLMIAFSAFDEMAEMAEKALGIASDPVGAAVGNKPLLRNVLTKILP
jgi:hypothetical protein